MPALLPQPAHTPGVSPCEIKGENTMSDLRPVHVPSPIDPGNQGKIIAGVIVALAIIALGIFGFEAGWFHGLHQAVPDSRLPQASMPLTPSKG
jgi:hypothetical protein